MTKPRHKVFKSKPRITTPLTFDLEGEKTDGREWSESFTARPAIPGAILLDFIADADSNDGGRAAEALVTFMTDVLIEEDKNRFTDLIRDTDRIIEIELLGDICEWLVSEYASRPTEQSSTSVAGVSTSGTGSTEPSLAEA